MPEADLTSRIRHLWEDVIQVSEVEADDNFFALGGDSLLAVAMSYELETQLGRPVPLNLIFQSSSLREYANAISLRPEERQETGVTTIDHRPWMAGP